LRRSDPPVQGRKLVESGAVFDPVTLADTGTPLKDDLTQRHKWPQA
jgi:hypothetical protein